MWNQCGDTILECAKANSQTLEQIKAVKEAAELNAAEISERGAMMAKLPVDKITGKLLLDQDVCRLQKNRDLMMDLLYVQMAEHSRKLSLFSNMYDCASETVGVEAEFFDSMQRLKIFDQ